MAQAGNTPILLYASGTASNAPLAANLTSDASGAELALNYADGKLYYKNSSNVVALLASTAGALGDVVGPASATSNNLAAFDGATGKLIKQAATVSVAQGGTGLTSYTANGVLYASAAGTLANGSGLTYGFGSGNLGLGVATAFYRFEVETTTNFVTPYIASFKTTSTSTTEANLIRITQNASGAATGIIGTFGSAYSGSTWANTFGVLTSGSSALALGTNNIVRVHIDTSGNAQMRTGAVMPYSPAPASISTTATLANADIQAQIINTTGTSYTVLMPLGTTLESITTWIGNDIGYDFAIINTASGTITIAANTGVTALGLLTIATGTSAQFRIRRTAANTFVLYRLS